MIALIFATPLMLVGLIAGAIPLAMHLLSRVRAREEYFPSLRLLRLTVNKTAHRRRIQNWLLLLLRCAVLAILALAAAEPISQATAGWLADDASHAAIVVDNSYSMAATPTDLTQANRFAHAKDQASHLLSGPDKPQLATLAASGDPDLTGQLDTLRGELARTHIAYGRPELTERIVRAAETLAEDTPASRALYLFTDAQRADLDPDELTRRLRGLDLAGVHVFIVTQPSEPLANIAVTDVAFAGPTRVNGDAALLATIRNTSAVAQKVDVELRLASGPVQGPFVRTLAPAGENGETATLRFQLPLSRPGPLHGNVRALTNDALPVDNVRYLAANVADRARTVIVHPPERPDVNPALDPAGLLQAAFQWPESSEASLPVEARTAVMPGMTNADLSAFDSALFCEIPAFEPAIADALTQFVREGGTAVFFLGPDVNADNYNARFGPSGLLPGRLGGPVGEIGLQAQAIPVSRLDTEHPLLANLFATPGDYPRPLVGRHLRLEQLQPSARVLLELADGQPLLVTQPLGRGQALWCTTTASARWSDLLTASAGLTLPMLFRATLGVSGATSSPADSEAGQPVTLDLRERVAPEAMPAHVDVALPESADGDSRRVAVVDGVAVFAETRQPGVYTWSARQADGLAVEGVFAINAWNGESDLTMLTAEELVAAFEVAGVANVYVGASVDDVHAQAAARSQGRNWWDLLAAGAVILLVAEVLVANRQGRWGLATPASRPASTR